MARTKAQLDDIDVIDEAFSDDTADTTADEDTAPEAKAPAKAKAPEAPARVRILLPLVPGVLEDDVIVGVNGKNYLIRRGESVEVPPAVAFALQRSNRLSQVAAKNAERLASAVGAEALK